MPRPLKHNKQTQSTTWLQSFGESLAHAPQEDRAQMMLTFVNRLVDEGTASCRDVAWVTCAEAYANALVIVELTDLVDNLGRNRTVSM